MAPLGDGTDSGCTSSVLDAELRCAETQSVATRGRPTVRSMAVDLTQLTQTEQAVADTLRGLGAELDNEQKFWWADWTNMIRDTITAMRTGDPVMYEDKK